jgi:hypothetical protein
MINITIHVSEISTSVNKDNKKRALVIMAASTLLLNDTIYVAVETIT